MIASASRTYTLGEVKRLHKFRLPGSEKPTELGFEAWHSEVRLWKLSPWVNYCQMYRMCCVCAGLALVTQFLEGGFAIGYRATPKNAGL